MRTPWLIVAVLALTGCQFDRTIVPVGFARVVVHGVLDPSAETQTIFVERTLTGRIEVGDGSDFNRNDPIVTGGGDPVRDALVVVHNAAGDSVVAPEDAAIREDGRGAGVYRFSNADLAGPLRIRPGGHYFLRVTTPDGDVVTGETVVPFAQNVPPASLTRFFNRDTDTLNLFWDAAPGTYRYMVRVDSPFGPLMLFTDELETRLPGTIRNFLDPNLRRIFLPGFRTNVGVSALDQNYFDYVRSGSDPFTGRGIINHLKGGLGVFGAVVPLYTASLIVEANVDEPIEGHYRLAGPSTGRLGPSAIRLWVESRVGDRAYFSGTYESGSQGTASFVGHQEESTITFAFLQADRSVGDTLGVFVGEYVRDSLIGVVRRGSLTDQARYGKPSLSLPGVSGGASSLPRSRQSAQIPLITRR